MILLTIFLLPTFFLALIVAMLIIASMGTFSSRHDDQGDRPLTNTDKVFPSGQLLPPS